MIVAGTKICEGFRTAYRQIAVEELAGKPLVALSIDRESEPSSSPGRVEEVPGFAATVLVTLVDGREFRCSPDTDVLVVGDAVYVYERAVDLEPGTMLVPLGKWRPPFRSPVGKVVASVTPAEPVEEIYAVRVTGPRQNFAIAAGVYLAADKE